MIYKPNPGYRTKPTKTFRDETKVKRERRETSTDTGLPGCGSCEFLGYPNPSSNPTRLPINEHGLICNHHTGYDNLKSFPFKHTDCKDFQPKAKTNDIV